MTPDDIRRHYADPTGYRAQTLAMLNQRGMATLPQDDALDAPGRL